MLQSVVVHLLLLLAPFGRQRDLEGDLGGGGYLETSSRAVVVCLEGAVNVVLLDGVGPEGLASKERLGFSQKLSQKLSKCRRSSSGTSVSAA